MDQLRPLIVHKFWVLFGMALLLPTIGWWMASSRLSANIDDRTKKVKNLFDTLPKAAAVPNAKWIDSAKGAIGIQQTRLNEASGYLWDTQLKEQTWPKNVRALMADLPFRGEIPISARNLYRTSYFDEVKELYQIVEPFDPQTGEGKVDVDKQTIPQIRPASWQRNPPEVAVMWDVQEDVWLLRSLLGAIARVNRDAKSITDDECYIRQIQELQLVGGGRSGTVTTAEPVVRNKATRSDVEAAGGSAAAKGLRGSRPKTGGKGVFKFETAFGPKPDARYVDDDPAQPFKTCGFYLKVIMNHHRLPDLIGELESMPFPAEIVHINQEEYGEGRVVDDGEGEGGRKARPRGFGEAPAAPPTRPGGPGDVITPAQAAKNKLVSALAEPHLATVIVGGIMTIYRPPAAPKVDGKTKDTKPGGNVTAAETKPAPASPAAATPDTTAEPQPAETAGADPAPGAAAGEKTGSAAEPAPDTATEALPTEKDESNPTGTPGDAPPSTEPKPASDEGAAPKESPPKDESPSAPEGSDPESGPPASGAEPGR